MTTDESKMFSRGDNFARKAKASMVHYVSGWTIKVKLAGIKLRSL